VLYSFLDVHKPKKQVFATEGFDWDFYHNGDRKCVELIPFMLFLKGDTVEHYKHTGHYGDRNLGVKSFCRYCVCPNEKPTTLTLIMPKKVPYASKIHLKVRHGRPEIVVTVIYFQYLV
jgi:hypothetical protein